MNTTSQPTKDRQSHAALPPLAERWLTPTECERVKAQQAQRYGQRAFQIDLSSFFAQFVEQTK